MSYDEDGFAVLRAAVAPDRVAAARRLLFLAIRMEGLGADEIAACQGTTFFPQLRWDRRIWDCLPEDVASLFGWRFGDAWCEPQILLRLPDEEQEWHVTPHRDEEPEWAAGRRYKGIIGVALTDVSSRDGATRVWPGSHRGEGDRPINIAMKAGDALAFHPQLGHAGTLNLGSNIRAALFFRLLSGS